MTKDFKFGMIAGMIFSAVFLVYYLVSSSPEQSDSARAVSSSGQSGQQTGEGNMSMTVLPLRNREQGYLPEGEKDILERLQQVRQRPADEQASPSVQTPRTTPTPAPPPQQKKTPRTYTVASGDTLSDISMRFYGTTTKWPMILDANRKTLKNPGELKPGMELTIPQE